MDGEDLSGKTVGGGAILFLVLATLAMVSDGYDLAVMGLIVPELVKTWHVAPGNLVPTLSAGVIGLLVGAPTLGYAGDRLGRKRAMLICLVMMGVFSLLNMFAQNLTQFVILRFLTGVGLGGLSPIIIAAAAEAAPRRLRGLFVIIVNFGVPAGLAVPGWTAALLVPHFGWRVLLLVGGVLPLAIGLLYYILVRESPAFVAAGTPPGDAPQGRRFSSLRTLFAGNFALITPMCWLLLAANQFTNFFTLSWLPTLLQLAGLGTAQAGVSASFYAIGGVVGGLALTVVIDRFGAIPLIVLFLIGAPAVAAIGIVDPSTVSLAAAVAGFCVTGNNFATNAVLGMIYRTRVRSLGTGSAHAAGRLGALAAQIVGGLLFARHLTMQDMYFTPAAVLLVGALASVALVLLCHREFGNNRLDAVVAGGNEPQDRMAPARRVVPDQSH